MPYDGAGFEHPEVRRPDAAIALIDTPEKWCKERLRTGDGRRCMLGALVEANAAIDMHEMTSTILLAIKQVTGLNFLRIEAFNDHPKTTHATVMQVLSRARQNLVAGVDAIGAVGSAPAPGAGFVSRIRKSLTLA